MIDDIQARERAALAELTFELSAPHDLKTIAARLGLSAEYVRQIQRRALGKLERAARRSGLDVYANEEVLNGTRR
jgi:DNA-directed RNA polymerase sigma subunit (sigma70/sigma32)